MQAECRKILKNLKDGKSKFQELKDSCNTGMWVAGGIAILCLVVVGLIQIKNTLNEMKNDEEGAIESASRVKYIDPMLLF